MSWDNYGLSGIPHEYKTVTPMSASQFVGNGHQRSPVYDTSFFKEQWEAFDSRYLCNTHFNYNKMADTKTLSADEKMIVRALKNEKPASEIAMLVVVARLTGRTPAMVMEVLDDVTKLVNEKLEEKSSLSLGAGNTSGNIVNAAP